MFEIFTDRARKAMAVANREAQKFNHEYIGTEHILLGLVQNEGSVAAHLLRAMGVDLGQVQLEVRNLVRNGPDMVATGKLPQTPRAKRVIEYAIEESRDLEHHHVGTEHLLLGLLRVQDGVAAKVLANLGVQLVAARTEAQNLLQGRIDRAPVAAPGHGSGAPIDDGTWALLVTAGQEAAAMSSNTILPEHLLLAMLKDPDSALCRILAQAGLDFEQARKRIHDADA